MAKRKMVCASLTCPKYKDHRCCVECSEKGCEDRCLNHPDRCGLVRYTNSHPPIVGRSGRKYTSMDPYEAERLYNDGLTWSEIAEKLGVTRDTIVAWAKAEGVW